MRLIQMLTTSLLIASCAAAGGDPNNPDDDGAGGVGSGDGSGGGSGSGNNDEPSTDPTVPTTHPRIYLGPNRDRLTAALGANTVAARRFKSSVDSWMAGGDLWGFPPWNAALMGQLDGNPQYCAAAIAATDAEVATAESAIASGSAPEVARDSYLYIGEEIGGLALVYDWCFDTLTSSQRARWIAYADQAVWNVWHHETATWGTATIPWTGWSIDNPSNNYYYSFLRATLLVGLATKSENPNADTWIKQFREVKFEHELVPTYEADLQGGGSREGTGYGQSMRRLFELYDIWYATTGESISRMTQHTRASMLDYVHKTMPTLDRTAHIGDHSRESTSAYFDYDRDYLQKLIALFPNDGLSGRVKSMLAASSVPEMDQGFMVAYDFLYDRPTIVATTLDGLNPTYYAPGLGTVCTRSGWDKHATWVNMIAGPYTESHAHQDQGSIMIFKDGWLAYDANHDTQSGVRTHIEQHSLVMINRGGTAIRQRDNTFSEIVGLHQGPGWMHMAADVTAAYAGDADISKVQREVVYLAPDTVVVYDRVTSTGNTTQTWGLVSPVRPQVSGATATFNGDHTMHVARLVPSAATASIHDFTSDADYKGGWRLDASMPGGDQRYLHVLSIDNAATQTTAIGDTGVTIQLADGRDVTLEFARNTVGATMTIDGVTTALTATVDTLPE